MLLNVCLLIFYASCTKTDDERVDNDEVIVSPPNSLFHTSVPAKPFDIIITRPAPNSVTLSVLSYKTCEVRIDYCLCGGTQIKSISESLSANQPKEIRIPGLMPNASYTYTYAYKTPASGQFIKSQQYSYNTVKSDSHPFVFAVQADSHLDMNTDTAIYKKTLKNIAEDKPDFLVDLGDTFMNDKYGNDFSMALYNYIAQRYYFGSICHSIPLYFVQGNHDGESGMYNDGSEENRAVWSNSLRKKYYPMPQPDEFYSGNSHPDPYGGNLQNYYAWEWSNALFVVLDPFWYTSLNGQKEPWNRTIGNEQYDWLNDVLDRSQAKFKFVFIHNLVGGTDVDGKARGGAEVAGYYEWGGASLNDEDEFSTKRPGWEMPIHDLLLKYHVNAVFHGHDHFFGYQQKDGIIYQELPQPGVNEDFQQNQAESYGYQQGTFLGGTGYLRVSVNSNSAQVEYIRTHLKAQHLNKEVAFNYYFN